jgi:hypothetical protein
VPDNRNSAAGNGAESQSKAGGLLVSSVPAGPDCCRDHAADGAVKVPVSTHGMQRGSLEWLNAMLSVEGVRLKWHAPAQQAAHVAGLKVSA